MWIRSALTHAERGAPEKLMSQHTSGPPRRGRHKLLTPLETLWRAGLYVSFFLEISLALTLGQTGMSEIWIGAMFEKEICPRLVIEDPAEPVAFSGCRKPRRQARLAHGIYVNSEVD